MRKVGDYIIRRSLKGNWGLFRWSELPFMLRDFQRHDCPYCLGRSVQKLVTYQAWECIYLIPGRPLQEVVDFAVKTIRVMATIEGV